MFKNILVPLDGEQLSEKKLRRLEKNRLSARECRRRKREMTESDALQTMLNLRSPGWKWLLFDNDCPC